MYLKKGLSNTIRLVKKNKLLFTGLVFLQLFIFVIASITLLNYQVKILTEAQEKIRSYGLS